MAYVALLGRLITRIKHDDDNATTANEIKTVTRAKIDSQLRHVTFNRLPVAQVPCLGLPQPSTDTNPSPFVFEIIKPVNELFGLENGVHARYCSYSDTIGQALG